jgi:hypothetical protein
MSVGSCIIPFITTTKEGLPMATKLYTIESLLVGKNYRSNSRHFSGEIVSAKARPEIWYGDKTEAFLIEVRTGGLRNKFATIAVKVGE